MKLSSVGGGVSPNRRNFRQAEFWPRGDSARGNFPYFRSNPESSNAAMGIRAGSGVPGCAPPTIENRKVPAHGAFGAAQYSLTEFSAVRAYTPWVVR